ncbi:pyridoxamine 5'-phosphate oxidase family protein [Kitasatospora sp. NPDC059571]|uniref:pyridoxamine 5'-phosphate oxidase family protein n=1 Tax=Kitasatospora sp. NPDC059571 TaxID=3346871 RepID=UPI0036A02B24
MTAEFTPLDERQCLSLLGRAAVGRLVYTTGALPAVLPVRYRLSADGSVLLRTDADPEIARAVADAVVAFEVSQLDEADGSGWTVTVLGRADVIRPANDARPLTPDPPGPATATDRATVRIRAELVTGRSLAGTPVREAGTSSG